MKLYKLKEEVLNYVSQEMYNSLKDVKQTEKLWEKSGYIMNALEEVPQKIKVIHTEFLPEGITILKIIGNQVGKWEDIETFLNDFGSMDKLYEAIDSYDDFRAKNEDYTTFQEWFKDNRIK